MSNSSYQQGELFFDGDTYDPLFDQERLGAQSRRVLLVMRDAQWRTLGEISKSTGDPEASISARLRDFRKVRFGGHTVNRQRRGDPADGLFEYQLIVHVDKRDARKPIKPHTPPDIRAKLA